MSRTIDRLTADTLADLPDRVRECLFWELDPVTRSRAERDGLAAREKEAWVSHVLLEWGSCGRVLYVDGSAAGFVLYGPPSFFAGSASLPTSPVPDDAVQLATAWVSPEHQHTGLGRVLMQAMVKDLLKRGGYRAVEAIGSVRANAASGDGHGQRQGQGRRQGGGPGPGPGADAAQSCVLPAEFLARVGFRTHRQHPLYPRLRLDLRSVLTWREEVEAALERLVGVVVPRPAPATPDRRV